MKKLIAGALLCLFVAGCSSTSQEHHQKEDNGPYTDKDLERDTSDVYRPSNSGKDDDGVEKGERKRPVRDTTVKEQPAKEPADPGPSVKQPKDDRKHDPAPEVKKPTPDPGVEEPVEEPEDKPEDEPIAEPRPDRSALIKGFISDVSGRMNQLEESKLWKDLLKAKERFDASTDKALEKGNDERGKDAEAAWANAIRDWYEVRYMSELFRHINWSAPGDFEIDGPLNEEVVGECADQHLVSSDCAQAWAAYELIELNLREVRQFQTDILKYDLVASKVFTDAKQGKKWSSQKQKWQDALNGTFNKGDLQKYGK